MELGSCGAVVEWCLSGAWFLVDRRGRDRVSGTVGGSGWRGWGESVEPASDSSSVGGAISDGSGSSGGGLYQAGVKRFAFTRTSRPLSSMIIVGHSMSKT